MKDYHIIYAINFLKGTRKTFTKQFASQAEAKAFALRWANEHGLSQVAVQEVA